MPHVRVRAILTALTIVVTVARGASLVATTTVGPEYDSLLYAHLVVHGTIENVDVTYTTLADWGVKPTEWARTQSQKTLVLTIAVDEVLRGAIGDANVDVWAFESSFPNAAPGTDVFIAAFYNEPLGVYFIRNRGGVFTCDDDLCDRLDGEPDRLSAEQISAIIWPTKLEQVVSASELVVVGLVTKVENRTEEDPDGEKYGVEEITLDVTSVLKGQLDEPSVRFSMITVGFYNPAWRGPTPGRVYVGEVWYAFLRRSELGYCPVGGLNGLLLESDDGLKYGRVAPYERSKSAVQNVIREMKQ